MASKKRTGYEVIEHAKSLQRVATARRLGVSSKLFESRDTRIGYTKDLEDNDDTLYGGGEQPTPSTNNLGSRQANTPVKAKPKDRRGRIGEDTFEGLSVGGSGGYGDTGGYGAHSKNSKAGISPTSASAKTQKQSPRREDGRRLSKGKYSVGGQDVSADIDGIQETTVYGDSAKQEVGHDAKQGKQKPMQSLDDPSNAGSDPNLRKKGSNTHKEDGMLEGYGAEMYADIPEGASWEETKQALEKALRFYEGRAGRLNQSLAMQMKRALNLHMQTKDEAGVEDAGSAPLNEAVNKLVRSVRALRKSKKG